MPLFDKRATLRATCAFAVIALALILNLSSGLFKDAAIPRLLDIWPSQLIFGQYFVVLVLCVQRLQADLKERRTITPNQKLFLLALIGLCSDLVSVNSQEQADKVGAYYSVLVIWDLATFFTLLRAVDLAREGSEDQFLGSWLVTVSPLLVLGREILLIPYGRWHITGCDANWLSAYLDLVFGDLPVCSWALLTLLPRPAEPTRYRFVVTEVVFAGCVYWLLKLIVNVCEFIAPPFARAECDSLLYLIPMACVAIAVGLTAAVYQWDPLTGC
jgi:hypothetical protein